VLEKDHPARRFADGRHGQDLGRCGHGKPPWRGSGEPLPIVGHTTGGRGVPKVANSQ
jgi:hypothetical protein